MKYTNVKNPKYISDSKEYIECEVEFAELGTINFLAYQHDVEEHSREIYQRASRGEFGSIAEYVQVEIKPTAEHFEILARNQRNQLLQEIDQLVTNPFRFAELSQEQKDQLAQYRRELLDITDQPGFPTSVVWPSKPETITGSRNIVSGVENNSSARIVD